MRVFFVHYVSLPPELEDHVRRDAHIKLSKDGVHRAFGRNMPRLTLVLTPVSLAADTDRVRDLVTLLDQLQREQKIVGYTRGQS